MYILFIVEDLAGFWCSLLAIITTVIYYKSCYTKASYGAWLLALARPDHLLGIYNRLSTSVRNSCQRGLPSARLAGLQLSWPSTSQLAFRQQRQWHERSCRTLLQYHHGEERTFACRGHGQQEAVNLNLDKLKPWNSITDAGHAM